MNIPKTISRTHDQHVYCPEVNDAPQRCLPVMDWATFPQNTPGNPHSSKNLKCNLTSKTMDSPQVHADLGNTKATITINAAEATNASDYPLKKIMADVKHKVMKRQRSSDSCMPVEFRIMKPGVMSENNFLYTPITGKVLNSEVHMKEKDADNSNSQEDYLCEVSETLHQSPFVSLQNRGTRLQAHLESVTKLPFTKRNTCDVFMNLQSTKETKPVVLSQDANQQETIDPCGNNGDTNTTNLCIKQNLRQSSSSQKCVERGNICMQDEYGVDGQEGNQNVPFNYESCKGDEKGYERSKRIIFTEEKLVAEGGKNLQGQKTMPISCPSTFGINTQLPNIHDAKQNYGHNVRNQPAFQKNESGTVCFEKLAASHPNRYINMSNLSVKILDFSDIVMKYHSASKMAMLWRNSNARKVCHTLRRSEACQSNNDTCTKHESLPYMACTASSDNKMGKSQDQLSKTTTEIYKESLHKRIVHCNDRKAFPSRENQRITVVRYEPFELAAISRSAKRRCSINDLNPSVKKQLRHNSPGCSLREAEPDDIKAKENAEAIYSDEMAIFSEPLDKDHQILLARSEDKTGNDLKYFVKDFVHSSDTGSSFSGSDIRTTNAHVPPLDPILSADTENQRRKILKTRQSLGNLKLLHDHLDPESGQDTVRCHSADEFQSESYVQKESEKRSVSVGSSSGGSGIKVDIFKMWGICKVIKQWKHKIGTDKETKADAPDITVDDSRGYQTNKEVKDLVTSCPEKSEGEKDSHEERRSRDSGNDASADQTPELTGEDNASSNKNKQTFYTTSLLIYFLSKWRTRIRNEINITTGQGNNSAETATPINMGKVISTKPKEVLERTWSSIKRDLTELILNSYLAEVENLNQEVLSLSATLLEEKADAHPKSHIIAISTTLPLKERKSSRLGTNKKQENRGNTANIQSDTAAVTSSEINPCLKADGETDTGVTLERNLSLTYSIQIEKDVGTITSQISTHYKPHEMHGKYPKQTKKQRKKSRDLVYSDTKSLYNRAMSESRVVDGDVDFINEERRDSVPPIIQACNELPAHVLLNSRVCSDPKAQMKTIINRQDAEELSTMKRLNEQASNSPNSTASHRKEEKTNADMSPNLPVTSPHKRLLLSYSPLEDDVFLSTPSSPASEATIYTLNTFIDEKHDHNIDNYGPFYLPSFSNTEENWQNEKDDKSEQSEKLSDVEKNEIGTVTTLPGTDANKSTENSANPREGLTLNTTCLSKNDLSIDERSSSQCIHENVIKCSITHSEDESKTQSVSSHHYMSAKYSELPYKPILVERKDAGINSSEGDATGTPGEPFARETKGEVGSATEYNAARSKQQPSDKYMLVTHDVETQDIINPCQPATVSSDRIRHDDAGTELLEEGKRCELSNKVSSLRFAEEGGPRASISVSAAAGESEDGTAAEKKLGNSKRSKNVKSPRSRPKSVEVSKTSDPRVTINKFTPGHLAVSPSVSSLRSEERRQEVKERRARAMEQIGPLPLLRSPLLRYKTRDDSDHDHITEDTTRSPSSLLRKWRSFRGQTEQQADRPSIPRLATNNDRGPSCLRIFACCSHYNNTYDEN